jgi:hypothetical protein
MLVGRFVSWNLMVMSRPVASAVAQHLHLSSAISTWPSRRVGPVLEDKTGSTFYASLTTYHLAKLVIVATSPGEMAARPRHVFPRTFSHQPSRVHKFPWSLSNHIQMSTRSNGLDLTSPNLRIAVGCRYGSEMQD